MEFKGYTFGYGAKPGTFKSDEGKKSMDACMALGLNWICIPVPVDEETYSSTEITFDYKRNLSYKDVMFAVQRAHENGVRVCLKPMVNCKDGAWRASIDFPDGDMVGRDVFWEKWFESYNAFMLYYAEMAEDTGCEMLCIGCEMLGTERKTDYWRKLINKIRKVYHGKLVYNTNHGSEDKVEWFDALDYIGTSAYYRVGTPEGSSASEMKAAWKKVAAELSIISKRFNKKIIFMEIGCRSAKGLASMPWDFAHKELPFDEDEQAAFYESVLDVMKDEKWFDGFFWWDWSAKIYDDREAAQKDQGFNIHLKKAEQVLKKYYALIK